MMNLSCLSHTPAPASSRADATVFDTVCDTWREMSDPFGLVSTTQKAAEAWLNHPDQLNTWLGQWMRGFTRLSSYAALRLVNQPAPEVVPANPEDDRFNAPVWSEQVGWDLLKQWYLFNTHWIQDALYCTPDLDEKERNRAAFWLRQVLNMTSPTNFFWTNPVALNKAVETQGESVTKGIMNFLGDVARGDISMTDLTAFEVGKNLATTQGAVVHRGRMLEVIHYAPTTEKVQEIPVVIVSPWINKFYVLDLDPKKSLVKFLVDQGFSVFITSWKNPDAADRGTGLEAYLTEGIDTICQVARDLTGSSKVHLAGYCIGGTLTTTYLAWLAAQKRSAEVASGTLFTTLTDFSRPGDIEVFIDEEGIAFVERKMAQRGYLDGKDMAASFRMLRANSLIWNFWVNNYLMGETPKPFDLLFWNMDTTRMPEKMHSFYLRELYMKNRLIEPNALTLAGQKIDLGKITTPLFMISAEEDHIAPWKQTWALTQRATKAPLTFTLSTSGHILGIINPPSPTSRRKFWQGAPAAGGERCEDWLARQARQEGSWWPSWVEWLRKQHNQEVEAVYTTERFPELAAAPGTYVKS